MSQINEARKTVKQWITTDSAEKPANHGTQSTNEDSRDSVKIIIERIHEMEARLVKEIKTTVTESHQHSESVPLLQKSWAQVAAITKGEKERNEAKQKRKAATVQTWHRVE